MLTKDLMKYRTAAMHPRQRLQARHRNHRTADPQGKPLRQPAPDPQTGEASRSGIETDQTDIGQREPGLREQGDRPPLGRPIAADDGLTSRPHPTSAVCEAPRVELVAIGHQVGAPRQSSEVT